MIDTTYKICSAQASSNYSEVIYEIKARLLEKNIEIDTKEKLEFFDVSKVPHAKDLQELLKNIVFWECAKGDNKESYLLIVEEDDWENSSSMESLGDKIHYLPIPATKAARIFNDLLTHGEKIAA
jgi:hypothetical protein